MTHKATVPFVIVVTLQHLWQIIRSGSVEKTYASVQGGAAGGLGEVGSGADVASSS
jgi:hypothetical protein